MSLTPNEINSIVDALQKSEWDEAVIEVGDVRIAVARNGAQLDGGGQGPQLAAVAVPAAQAAPAPQPAPTAHAAPAQAAASPSPVAVAERPIEDGHVVTAPSVGVFWRSPEPGAKPFVEVGDSVQTGDTLCIVEIMKLMNNVVADVSGEIAAVHSENGQNVEFGTPLFTVIPVKG